MKKAILLHEASDDVGVAVMDLIAGEEVGAVTLEGKDVRQVRVISDVPLGHKVAMVDMTKGKKVIEYGRVIGASAASISMGEHVHIHNLKSLRWAASKTKVLEK
jgi:(2R)-sulfolactate sulfo-lyase subunit alpha